MPRCVLSYEIKMETQTKVYRPSAINSQIEVQNILDDQQQLEQTCKKVSHLLNKNIYIISGDFDVRYEINAHLKALGFRSQYIRMTHSSDEIINKILEGLI